MAQLVECVPNVSEGRDRTVIESIAAEIRRVAGVKLLDVDSGAAANRTVYTFAGPPASVVEAALGVARRAAALIDMSRHSGAHPRIGALDVCPLIPISGVTMEECAALARELGRRIADELGIPVYFYEHAATTDGRRSLAAIRAGEYEGLPEKLRDPKWAPDCGPPVFNPRLGAAVVGAREFLVAYNVSLNTRDARLADAIARRIRESGRVERDEAGRTVRVPGRLKATRAIGWYIDEYRQAQVSINLLNIHTTPLHLAFETVREEAAQLGLVVTGSEIVGLAPLQVLVEAGRYYLRRQGKSTGAPEAELVETAIQSLGLSHHRPFEPAKKIVEYAVRPPAPLADLPVARFLDDTSSGTPTPGGGSAAALAGSLAAALTAMLANLTVGQEGRDNEALGALAERAQHLKDALAALIDDDARAFEAVVAARRLPRGTDAEREARRAAVQSAMREATDVPLRVARLSHEALELAGAAAESGRPDAASDAGTAALLARAAVEGALLNVLINLPGIRDADFAAACRREAEQLSASARARCDALVEAIHEHLRSTSAAR